MSSVAADNIVPPSETKEQQKSDKVAIDIAPIQQPAAAGAAENENENEAEHEDYLKHQMDTDASPQLPPALPHHPHGHHHHHGKHPLKPQFDGQEPAEGKEGGGKVVSPPEGEEVEEPTTPKPFGDECIEFQDGSWIYCMRRPTWLNSLLLVFFIALGLLEGVAFAKVGMADPRTISGGLTFETWILFKVFISAVGASMIAQSFMDIVMPSFFRETRLARYGPRPGHVRTIIGGVFTGIGLAMCAGGPTIIPAQVGVNAENAFVSACGMLLGGAFFYVLDVQFLHEFQYPVDDEVEQLVIDEMLGVRYWHLALPGGIVMFVFAVLLEYVIPGASRTDDQYDGMSYGELDWPAVTAGAVIGVNQIFSRLIAHAGEGGSSSVMMFLSVVSFGFIAPKHHPITKLEIRASDLEEEKKKEDVAEPDANADASAPKDSEKEEKNKGDAAEDAEDAEDPVIETSYSLNFMTVWQFAYVWIGTTLGALAVSQLSKDAGETQDPRGRHWSLALVGGFLLMMGARIAHGCVCGRSISQIAELGGEAITTTMGTFVGAIATAFIIKAGDKHYA